jgi:hypothetical protein
VCEILVNTGQAREGILLIHEINVGFLNPTYI